MYLHFTVRDKKKTRTRTGTSTVQNYHNPSSPDRAFLAAAGYGSPVPGYGSTIPGFASPYPVGPTMPGPYGAPAQDQMMAALGLLTQQMQQMQLRLAHQEQAGQNSTAIVPSPRASGSGPVPAPVVGGLQTNVSPLGDGSQASYHTAQNPHLSRTQQADNKRPRSNGT
jgi:hypothetical protein